MARIFIVATLLGTVTATILVFVVFFLITNIGHKVRITKVGTSPILEGVNVGCLHQGRLSLFEQLFLLLQNDRHGTWSFAKGHLEDGEDLITGALREVAEETGLNLTAEELDPHFGDTSLYEVDGRHKRVVYFLLPRPIAEQDIQTSAEHRDLAWLTEEDAVGKLAYSDLKRTVLRAADRLLHLAHQEQQDG